MSEVKFEVQQSWKLHGLMFGCFLILAIPAIMYIGLTIMRFFMPFWAIMYVITVRELIKKNDVLKFTLRKDSLCIKRLTWLKLVETKYTLSDIRLTRKSSSRLSNGEILNEFELKSNGKIVGHFNDSKYNWDLNKLNIILSQVDDQTWIEDWGGDNKRDSPNTAPSSSRR